MVDTRELLLEAKNFRESIMRGEVKAQAENHSEGGRDDSIPF
jgi:hypothetical protein